MEWINIQIKQPEINSFAAAPLPDSKEIIAGKISWENHVELYLITSVDGLLYYIIDKWFPLPSPPEE